MYVCVRLRSCNEIPLDDGAIRPSTEGSVLCTQSWRAARRAEASGSRCPSGRRGLSSASPPHRTSRRRRAPSGSSSSVRCRRMRGQIGRTGRSGKKSSFSNEPP